MGFLKVLGSCIMALDNKVRPESKNNLPCITEQNRPFWNILSNHRTHGHWWPVLSTDKCGCTRAKTSEVGAGL